MKKLFFLIMLIFMSCSSGINKGRLEPYQTSNTYKGSFENIWADVVEYFAVNGFIIKDMDKSKGVISTDYIVNISEFDTLTDCSGIPEGAVLNNNIIDFHISANKENDSIVKILATTKFIKNFEMLNDKGIIKQDFFCESNGAFEKKFFDFMDRKTR